MVARCHGEAFNHRRARGCPPGVEVSSPASPEVPTIYLGSPLAEILAGLLSFAIGGIPFGWLFARFVKGIDLRKVGSGNIGATNASRLFEGAVSVAAFLFIFALDFGKGLCAALFGYKLGLWLGADAGTEFLSVICGASAILGHVFTPYLGFKGGKGVATTLGVVTAFAPWSSLAAVGTWGLLVGLTRYISLGSIGAMIAIPVAYVIHFGDRTWKEGLGVFLFFIALAGIVVWRHRENIVRILKGSERKLGAADQL